MKPAVFPTNSRSASLAAISISSLALLLLVTLRWPGRAQGEAQGKVWLQQGFADFSRGDLGTSNANLYVSAAGRLQMIHRWDLNNDGYVDLVFSNSHDLAYVPPVSVFSNDKGTLLQEPIELPGHGARKVKIADLNGDGFPEIILANLRDEERVWPDYDSHVYWGAVGGYSARYRTALLSAGARDVCVGDFNGDGSLDLFFANSLDDAQGVVYWGGPQGLHVSRNSQLPVHSATGCSSGDLDGDGIADLVVSTRGSTAALYWGARQGFGAQEQTLATGPSNSVSMAPLKKGDQPVLIFSSKEKVKIYANCGHHGCASSAAELPALNAQETAAADLNADGFSDLVVTDSGFDFSGTPTQAPINASYIYWGSPSGFSPNRRETLETHDAVGIAIADLNQDGRPDIVFANARHDGTMDTDSFVYWGTASGYNAGHRTRLPTHGATGVAAGALQPHGLPALVFANSGAGRTQGDVDTYVYWGNREAKYSPERRSGLPSMCSEQYALADLNDDGYPDAILAGYNSESLDLPGPSYIYWGGPQGFDVTRRSTLPVPRGEGLAVGDLDRDGYLDLVVSVLETHAVILYGSPDGFGKRKISFPVSMPRYPSIADLNRDGYLDVIVPSIDNGTHIFWGGKAEYSEKRKTLLPGTGTVSVEVVDLDGDGWLELITGTYWNWAKKTYAGLNSHIYWGSPEGYSATRVTDVPTHTAHQIIARDLNRDGYVDLLITHYLSALDRKPYSFIYWGNQDHLYSSARRTTLQTWSAAGAMVEDLNGDGWPDLVISNHFKDGTHVLNSAIWWGGPQGFSENSTTLLPTLGPHHMSTASAVNLYDHMYQETFTSMPFDAGAEATFTRLSWEGDTPFGTSIRFQIRVAASREQLEQEAWVGSSGANSYFVAHDSALAEKSSRGRWAQYRALLARPNCASTPVLKKVAITY